MCLVFGQTTRGRAECGKQWQSCGLARCAVQQEELPEAQRAARGAAGTVPEQRAQGALRPARAQRAEEMQQRRTRKRTPINTTKHQTRRARAQDGQQSKQGGRLKQRGRAQRAHV